jgi:hypothetical protein
MLPCSGGLVLGGSAEDTVKQYILFQCFTVSIGDVVGRFIPVVMVVERGNATGVLGLFKKKVLQ